MTPVCMSHPCWGDSQLFSLAKQHGRTQGEIPNADFLPKWELIIQGKSGQDPWAPRAPLSELQQGLVILQGNFTSPASPHGEPEPVPSCSWQLPSASPDQPLAKCPTHHPQVATWAAPDEGLWFHIKPFLASGISMKDTREELPCLSAFNCEGP